ncbi:Response regulator c-di-GMP phosphodiesterase, RpfG family, contains REC and HD-GYP domains [Andreprevotia lacus DSM 23236]|uniref:Response regulator c-di-GMP phosphodiesterase, RpfG family, contains REC and HD-GYP domains n=1 Tax=Andreprevotia lacus DSM 23236 TaxID=1121001 RepID=A0A1W1XFM7_9NEIS|nr:HD domain-containing phosphohydrolase [Andreprevotia lacus]SMC22763.1 Response regulator c-di-GMP phosphodiesterase, RpfG family, contains REC and HD-GYP domains [Andreprevotia lacus DSM 23236]
MTDLDLDALLAGDDDTAPFTVLCVDDESNILAALRRLFRGAGYRVLVAEGGAAALQQLEQEHIDLVISDMRMPGMSGADFLTEVRARWPDVVRILLTGYADMQSTIQAINQANISRYIAKPWEDDEVLTVVREALSVKRLEREKARLDGVVLRQNAELKRLNSSLEDKVRARTAELEMAMQDATNAHDKLKKTFITLIRVFSSLIEMRAGKLAGLSRGIADLARQIATRLELPENDRQDIFIAGLLHGIGKIGLPDTLLGKPFAQQTLEERNTYGKYPIKGQAALMALEQLQNPARLIRNQHERFDGLGFPDRLAGMQIPMGARILGLANDYENMQAGMITGKPMSRTEAIHNIESGRNKRYDPDVLDAFLAIVGTAEVVNPREREVRSRELEAGMVLARDLIAAGVMLLAKDYMLDQRLIGQIRHFEETDGTALKIFIQVK